MFYRWSGRYLPDRLNVKNEENYGSISGIVDENEDFAVYAPKVKKDMVTMGSMDINSTCDDGKVLSYLKNYSQI